MTTTHTNRLTRAAAALALAATLGLGACSSGTNANDSASNVTTTTEGGSGGTTDGQVLPVNSDPITNTATAEDLQIDSVLVENNVDETGAAVDDHLEIAVSNSGSTDLSGFEVFYTITDPAAGTSESYFAALPADFSVPAGDSRIIHFDNTGAADHFPVNQYSLYYTSTNQLEVTVEVSAQGVAVQTDTVNKDAGGAEVPD